MTEGEGDGIESRISSLKTFSTLKSRTFSYFPKKIFMIFYSPACLHRSNKKNGNNLACLSLFIIPAVIIRQTVPL